MSCDTFGVRCGWLAISQPVLNKSCDGTYRHRAKAQPGGGVAQVAGDEPGEGRMIPAQADAQVQEAFKKSA
jgi:hypothetical protein